MYEIKMKNIKLVGITLFVIICIVILGLTSFINIQNSAIVLEEQVRVAYSDINVQEKRREDLLYNLVDTVKNYDKHEAETLKSIVEGRSGNKGDISNVNTLISAVTEAYPELKSNKNYKQLMNELSTTENLIAQYRSNYNKEIKEYNRYIKKFPNKQILNFLGYEVAEFDYLNYNASSDAPSNLFGE